MGKKTYALYRTTINFSTGYYFSKSVFFSSTKKTIYLYPFTDSAGGQMERTETLVYSAMIVQTHAAMKTQMGNWPDFSSAITFFIFVLQ